MSLPPVRKRKDYRDIKPDDLVFALFYDRIAPLDAMSVSGETEPPMDAQSKTKAVMTAASANDLPDSAFLYIEPGGKKDADGKTVPRSLRHFPYRNANGGIDLPHLRNAIARIPQSNAPGLNKAALQKRAQAMLAKANASAGKEAKSFTVFKDASGKMRWILRTSTAFRDRDGEVITTKAQEDDAARMTATGQYGPLRYWHIGQPDPFDPACPWGPGLDLGMCDYSTVLGRTRIESGTFYDDAIGQAIAQKAGDYEGSPGFFHALDQPDAGAHFTQIRGFERSLVPTQYARASNLFTGLAVGKATKSMDQNEYNRRVAVFLSDMAAKGVAPEVAAGVIAQQQQSEKDADAQKIAYKSEDAPAELTINGVTYQLKAAPMMAPDAEDLAEPPETPGEVPDAEDLAEGPEEEGNYVGDMSPEEFSGLLSQAFTAALAPLIKAMDITGQMGAHMAEMKNLMGGYAMKDDARATELAALKAQQQELAGKIAAIEGDQPATILPDEVAAALKSAGPTTPPDQSTQPQIPDDPSRPWAGLAARLMPELYGGLPPQAN